MIGVVVRDMAFLKVLVPIMKELHLANKPYILYYMDCPRPGKEYARPTKKRLEEFAGVAVLDAKKIVSVGNDNQLFEAVTIDKVSKFVSLEIWLCCKWMPNKLRKHKIKSYSIQYLTDAILQPSNSITSVDKIYYMSEHIMRMHQQFSGTSFNPDRDKCLGSPLFDPIIPNNGSGDILVLTPNIREEHVNKTFGSTDNFLKIMSKLSKGGDLVFKTRSKQWLPQEARKYAKVVVDDNKTLYPPATTSLFKNCYMTVIFCSTGIYEAVCANNRVLNIRLRSLDFLGWKEPEKSICLDQKNGTYMFDGVSESIDQRTVLSDEWQFVPEKIDKGRRDIWIQKFIGEIRDNSSKLIVKDIINN